jgi:hypothetical protein
VSWSQREKLHEVGSASVAPRIAGYLAAADDNAEAAEKIDTTFSGHARPR